MEFLGNGTNCVGNFYQKSNCNYYNRKAMRNYRKFDRTEFNKKKLNAKINNRAFLKFMEVQVLLLLKK